MYQIPLKDKPWQKMTVVLDAVSYQLEFIWNTRAGAWAMNIYDAADDIVVAGIKLVVSYELIRRFRAYAVPAGAMYCYSSSAPFVEPTRDTLPDGVVGLVYVTADEWDAGTRMDSDGAL